MSKLFRANYYIQYYMNVTHGIIYNALHVIMLIMMTTALYDM